MVGYRICPLYCNKNIIISSQFHFLEKKKIHYKLAKLCIAGNSSPGKLAMVQQFPVKIILA